MVKREPYHTYYAQTFTYIIYGVHNIYSHEVIKSGGLVFNGAVFAKQRLGLSASSVGPEA